MNERDELREAVEKFKRAFFGLPLIKIPCEWAISVMNKIISWCKRIKEFLRP